MIYKPGDVFTDPYHGAVKCVADDGTFSGCGCDLCAFSQEGDTACTEREYDMHPCYHSDRGDDLDVHFVKL